MSFSFPVCGSSELSPAFSAPETAEYPLQHKHCRPQVNILRGVLLTNSNLSSEYAIIFML